MTKRFTGKNSEIQNELFFFARRLFFLVLLCFCARFACADVFEKRYRLKTDYFDIIYPAASERSAFYLAEHADGLYERLADTLNIEADVRFPVVFVSKTEVLQAYYSIYPYRRIVLYDAAPSDGALANFSDPLLSVFFHELVHGVSASIMPKYLKIASRVFGDGLSPLFNINFPESFLEGLAVSLESLEGEGRINEPLAREFLMEQKAGGRFLSWRDSSGGSDVYNAGSAPYYYGGFFFDYLRRNYGMDLYARFLKQNGAGLGLRRNFRKVYGVSLKNAWRSFYESIPTPETFEIPEMRRFETFSGVSDVTAADGEYFSGVVCADETSSSIWIAASAEGEKPELLTRQHLSEVKTSLSQDGAYLLISGYENTANGNRWITRIFDMTERRMLKWKGISMRDASFLVLSGGRTIVVGSDTSSTMVDGNALLAVDPFSGETLFRAPMPRGALAYSPCDAGGGRCAFICARGLERRIALCDAESILNGASLTDCIYEAGFNSPTPPRVRYLDSARFGDSVKLIFSWADGDSFYRFASADLSSGAIVAQTGDIYGGVHNPAAYKNKLFFSSLIDNRSELASVDMDDLPALCAYEGSAGISGESFFEAKGSEIARETDNSFEIKPYTPLPYFLRGVFLPLPTFTQIAVSDLSLNRIMPGFWYFTGSPDGEWRINLSAHYNASLKFARWEVSARYAPSPVSFSVTVKDEIAGDSALTLTAKTDGSVNRRLSASAAAGASSYILGGALKFNARTEIGGQFLFDEYNLSQIYAEGSIYRSSFSKFVPIVMQNVGFSSASRSDAGAYDYSGLASSIVLAYMRPTAGANAFLYQFLAEIYCARILPFRNPYPFTLNLPFSITFSAAGANGEYFSYSDDDGFAHSFPATLNEEYAALRSSFVYGGVARIVIAAADVQRAVPWIPLFLNRVSLVGYYRAYFFDSFKSVSDRVFSDMVTLQCSFRFSSILGSTTGASFDLSCSLHYCVRSKNMSASIFGLYAL